VGVEFIPTDAMQPYHHPSMFPRIEQPRSADSGVTVGINVWYACYMQASTSESEVSINITINANANVKSKESPLLGVRHGVQNLASTPHNAKGQPTPDQDKATLEGLAG
jgi:hypothetical protein